MDFFRKGFRWFLERVGFMFVCWLVGLFMRFVRPAAQNCDSFTDLKLALEAVVCLVNSLFCQAKIMFTSQGF